MRRLGADDVRRIADLARLSVGDDEALSLARDFETILAYLQRLDAVDTTGVTPFEQFHTPRGDVLRADTPVESLGLDAALRSAPAPTDDGSFGVPRVLGADG